MAEPGAPGAHIGGCVCRVCTSHYAPHTRPRRMLSDRGCYPGTCRNPGFGDEPPPLKNTCAHNPGSTT